MSLYEEAAWVTREISGELKAGSLYRTVRTLNANSKNGKGLLDLYINVGSLVIPLTDPHMENRVGVHFWCIDFLWIIPATNSSDDAEVTPGGIMHIDMIFDKSNPVKASSYFELVVG